MSKIKNYFLNTRPYSWADLLSAGLLAKYSDTTNFALTKTDIYISIGLLSLWIFYNLILEHKHAYTYRGKTSILLTYFFLILPIALSIYLKSYWSLVFIFISSVLVYIYLQKNKNKLLGILSCTVRGLIQVNYFLYILFLLQISLKKEHVILSLIIFCLYVSRAVVGDIRDIKHNAKKNKKTIPVLYGKSFSRYTVSFMMLFSSFLIITTFNTLTITLPLIMFALTLLTYKNGYILHQLLINTTMFFSFMFVGLSTNQNILYILLIYIGIYLNTIFYPLLKRESNPTFTN
ncbi:hypothetical protein C0581_04120 [Candidatus Parcubacteria bacterium]|nr:MAG: hypothetical protein C0581_04120 [Candidatus Parcubacteria bacterium]